MAPNCAMMKFSMINRIYGTSVCFTWLYIRFLFLDVTEGGPGIARGSPIWITGQAGAQLISPKLGWFFSPGEPWLCHFISDTKLGTHFSPKPITHHLLTTVTISWRFFFSGFWKLAYFTTQLTTSLIQELKCSQYRLLLLLRGKGWGKTNEPCALPSRSADSMWPCVCCECAVHDIMHIQRAFPAASL